MFSVLLRSGSKVSDRTLVNTQEFSNMSMNVRDGPLLNVWHGPLLNVGAKGWACTFDGPPSNVQLEAKIEVLV